jgi:hypothetical protein
VNSSLYLFSLLKLQAWLNNYRVLLLGLYLLFNAQALFANLEYLALGKRGDKTAAAN